MSEFTPSSYSNPETRPFGAFYDDLSPDQQRMVSTTVVTLSSVMVISGEMSRFRNMLMSALYDGFRTHSEYADWRDAYGSVATWVPGCYENRVAAWYDQNTKLMNVLEFNKVKGVGVRTYRLVKFIEKLMRSYRTYEYADEPLVPENVAPYVTQLFPSLDNYGVEVWDKPSDMYDVDVMGHINSCMVGTKYVRFYDTAPVKGLVVRNARGEAVARTLLWTLNDGRRVVDRIYDNDGMGQRRIHHWAGENAVLLEFPDDAHVIAPIHKGGHPYMDSLHQWVRVGDTAHLFVSRGAATKFKRTQSEAIDEVFDLTYTGGGPEGLTCDIAYHNGRWVPASQILTRDGVTYLSDELSNLEYHNGTSIEQDQLFQAWDYDTNRYIPVYGRECFLYKGVWYAKTDQDAEIDGVRVPKSRLLTLIRVVDGVLDLNHRVPDVDITSVHEELGAFFLYADEALRNRPLARRIRSNMQANGVSGNTFINPHQSHEVWNALVTTFGGEA